MKVFAMDPEVAEVLLVLGLHDKIAGVSFVSDDVWSSVKDEFAKLTQYGDGDYATFTEIGNTSATMIAGFYPSAFTSISSWDGRDIGYESTLGDNCSTIGDDNQRYCRGDLLNISKINSYLQPQNCEKASDDPEPIVLDTILDTIWELSSIFNVRDAGRKFMDMIEADILYTQEVKKVTVLHQSKYSGSTHALKMTTMSSLAVVHRAIYST